MARKKKTTPSTSTELPGDYREFLDSLKQRVRRAQTRAALSVSRELIQLYWDIGHEIVLRQEREDWGKSVVDRLARDIQAAFPGIKGFSSSNVWRMRTFYLAYTKELTNLAQPVRDSRADDLSQPVTDSLTAGLPHPVAEIPWGHNIVLLQKLKDSAKRLWYASKTVEHGWSRAVLTVQIESDLLGRQGKAVSNFAATLPSLQADLAQQTLKDPYLFDFLTLHDDVIERDLESGLVDHIQRFLLELGAGFAFVGRQFHLVVGEDDFYIDLLFYHLKLRCFVVIDLKMTKFTPEHAGKMNFYLSAIDSQLRHSDDANSIGLVLCKDRDQITAEYALRDIAKPIGVAEWQSRLASSLPESLRGSLPTIEEIERELASQADVSPEPEEKDQKTANRGTPGTRKKERP